MQVKQIMNPNPKYLTTDMSVTDAAKRMSELDCGFLPVGSNDRLDGVVTDRDIVLRAVAKEKDLSSFNVGEILSDKVLYCFEDDSVEEAATSMRRQQVQRLVVLNNRDEKRLSGIITLGDIAKAGRGDLVGETTEHIKQVA